MASEDAKQEVAADRGRMVSEDGPGDIIEYPNTPMHYENGAMKMRPGWSGVMVLGTSGLISFYLCSKRPLSRGQRWSKSILTTTFADNAIGKLVPCAYQKTVRFPDTHDTSTFWAPNSVTGRHLMITAEELTLNTSQNALIQLQTYRTPNFQPRQRYALGASTTITLAGRGEISCHELEIWIPLTRLFEVRKTTQRLTDQDHAKLIRRQHPHRKSYYFTASLIHNDLYPIVGADDPEADLVMVGDTGKLAHREFVETVYWMRFRGAVTDWEVRERGWEFVRVGERLFVLVTDGDVTEVQLFEAWHDKRVRRYWRELGSRGTGEDGGGG